MTRAGRDPGAVARRALATARAEAGLPVPPVVVDGPHRAALDVATATGAPLAPVLRRIERIEAAETALASEVARASAEGRAVAGGLVLGPPLLGLLTARLVTDDPVATLVTPAGRALLLIAGLLWLSGLVVVVDSVRRAARPPRPDDAVLVVAATAIRAGEPLPTALRRAATDPGSAGRTAARRRAGRTPGDPAALALWLDLGAAGPPPDGWSVLGPVVAEAVTSGVALAPLLDAIADDERRRASAAALERAARLGARLSVPTALLLLPAGLLLAAGPLLLAALRQLG